MPERFTQNLRAASEPGWSHAVEHRFVKELFAGVMPDAVMARYLIQDHRFLDARTNTNKMDRLPLSDDWPLERSVFQEIDARPHIHAAFDACAGDDAVADRGVRIAKESLTRTGR